MVDRQNEISNQDTLHKWRTELPNVIDDFGLSPHAYRVYGTFLRSAPPGSTPCTAGSKYLAQRCQMSTGKFSEAKRELFLAGLIMVEIRKSHHGDMHSITIVDIWAANFAIYSKTRVEQLAAITELKRSLCEQSINRSQCERYRSQCETRNKPKNRKEPIDLSTNVDKLNRAATASDLPIVPPSKAPETTPDLKTETKTPQRKVATKESTPALPVTDDVKDAFAVLCYNNKDAWKTNAAQMMRVLQTLTKAEGQTLTIVQLREFYTWWTTSDWRGKRKQPPAPHDVVATWATYKGSLSPDKPSLAILQPPKDRTGTIYADPTATVSAVKPITREDYRKETDNV